METKVEKVSASFMMQDCGRSFEVNTKEGQNAFSMLLNSARRKDEAGMEFDYAKQKNPIKKDEAVVKDTSFADKTKTVSKQKTELPEEELENETTKDVDQMLQMLCEMLGVTQEELVDQFDNLVNQVTELLMQEFGITEEELRSALDDMGMTMTQLFEPGNLMNVVVGLEHAGDNMAVLTNEELYGQLQSVADELNDIKESFLSDNGMTPEQLQQLEKNLNAERGLRPQEAAVKSQNVLWAQGEAPVLEQEQTLQTVETVVEKSTSHEQKSDHGQQMSGNEGFQQFVNSFVQNVDNANGQSFASQTVDMESIIRQLVEQVKIQVTEDVTSMEMQLHPESYGKLNLQVAIREGMLTAQLTVENEAVRRALESNIVQLKENMEQQGLKVDAIEVTIASHEFERNLEYNQDQQSAQEEQAKNGVRRQINLHNEELSLEELVAMSEAESLTRKMMLENGNSIDFNA